MRRLPAASRQSKQNRNVTHGANGVVQMEKLHNLKDCICSFDNLLGAYKNAAESKRYRDEVLAFTSKLEENLFDIQQSLLNRTYKVGRYREFYVQFPKPRLVMALGFRDRIVQWAIYRQLNPYVDKRYISHGYGCRDGMGTLAAAQQFCYWLRKIDRKPDADEWFIIKGDIAKYFYRVDHQKALETYAAITDDEWFLWLIGTIIDNPYVPFGLPDGMSIDNCPREKRLYDVGMPIGNLSSQSTANLFLNRLDQYCKHVLHIRYYIRYMDDFVILIRGKREAERILAVISDFLRDELLLRISPKSVIMPAKGGCEFVGCRISPHGIRIRKKTERHVKHALKHVADQYAAGEVTLEHCLQIVGSYMGLTLHKNGFNLRRWIEENIVFQRKEDIMKIPDATAPPTAEGRHFYAIDPQADGTVDVYLNPNITVYDTDTGVREYDARVRVVRGVVPFDGMEEDIRARFDAWCESAEVIDL